jgi:lipopolysaccharide/colanic/teichoic acid biosynthesis glycosyltransferase
MSQPSKETEITGKRWSAWPRSGTLNRAFDVLGAAFGLFVASPLFCAIGLAIKFDDGGPVFYRQIRVGRSFKRFRVCKFRTMVSGADRDGLLTAPGDHRVTRVGRFLRRSKLDELPQLFNVLKGDMQLVGPRPEVESYVEMFRPEYAILLHDRPGITDPATLAYRHEEKMFSPGRIEEQYVGEILPEKLRLSLNYQKQRTMLSDVRILVRTILGSF